MADVSPIIARRRSRRGNPAMAITKLGTGLLHCARNDVKERPSRHGFLLQGIPTDAGLLHRLSGYQSRTSSPSGVRQFIEWYLISIHSSNELD